MAYQHILVAVDLTEDCQPVIRRAVALGQCCGSKVSLVHVVEPMAMAFGGDVPMDLSSLQQQQIEQARERLDGFTTQYAELAGNCVLAYGQPRQEIQMRAQLAQQLLAVPGQRVVLRVFIVQMVVRHHCLLVP